jgi:hypothetical protein
LSKQLQLTKTMGYHLFSYGINTSQIEFILGCKDKHVLQYIKGSPSFKNYSEEWSHEMETALNHLIFKEKYDENKSAYYGYSLVSICAFLGHQLPYQQEVRLGSETDLITKYLNEDFGVTDVFIEVSLLSGQDPFDLPPMQDWPVIGLHVQQDVQDLYDKLKQISINTADIEQLKASEDADQEDKGFAYQHIQGILQNLEYCIKNDLALIVFCH